MFDLKNSTDYDEAVSKQCFVNWLKARKSSSKEIKKHVLNLDLASAWISDRNRQLFDIWSIKCPKKLDSIINSISSMDLSGTKYSIKDIRLSLLTYKKFLIELSNEEDDSHKEWRSLSVADTKLDYRKRLDSATKYLKSKYEISPANSLKQIGKENPLVSMACINVWTKSLFNETASEYLGRQGILTIQKKTVKQESPSDGKPTNNKTQLDEYINVLKEKYKDKPVKTYAQIRKENRNMPFSKIQSWVKDFYGMTIAQYLTDEGILSDEENELSDEELLSNLLDVLKERYKDKPASTYAQIKKENRDLSVSKMEKWTRSTLGLTAKDYLVKEGLILDLKSSIDLTNEQLLFLDEERDFMISTLSLDFYFIDDVKALYVDKFGDENINRINAANMLTCGYLYYPDYIIKNVFASAEEYFMRLLSQKDLFGIHDYDKRLIYDRYFKNAIDNLCRSYDYLEYNNRKYISIERCRRVNEDISKEAIAGFIEDVLDFLNENEYLTIRSLQNSGYDCVFFNLGFSDWLCSSILRYSMKFDCFKIVDSYIFYKGNRGRKRDRLDFIREIVLPASSIEVDDLIDILRNDYGINITRNRILVWIKESSMYYDKIMDKVYYKKEFYYDEL